MTRSMRFVTIVVSAVGLFGLGTGTASAEAAEGTPVALTGKLRACDFVPIKYVATDATGSGNGVISSAGDMVTATVDMSILPPFTAYQVRLIQGPRPGTQRCSPGDPGVASAVLNSDANGVGSVTLSAPRNSGATNAWVIVDGPPDPGQVRGEFYTSDQLTLLS